MQCTSETDPLLYNKEQILDTIPHRDPFVLIDGIVAFESRKRCCAVKYIDPEDRILQGHFPGRPIMPGVHIIENMAQTACFLLARDADEKDNLYVLAKINKAVFNRKVCGGETLFTEVTVERLFDELAIFSGTASVDGAICAKADLVVGINKREEKK